MTAGLHYNPAKAAEFLGISVSSLRKKIKEGVYRPTFVNKNGWKFFSLEDLKSYKEQAAAAASPSGNGNGVPGFLANLPSIQTQYYDAETSTRVIQKLNSGKSPLEICAETGIHVLLVRSIFTTWLELRNGVFLVEEQIERINALRLEGEFPLKNGETLVRNLELIAKRRSPTCARCKTHPRSAYCSTCASSIYEQRLLGAIEEEEKKKGPKGGRKKNESPDDDLPEP